VATGLQQRSVVEAMHRRLRAELAIDAIKACFCVEGAGCDCYKPKPGLLLEAAQEWGIDLRRSFVVGDRWRDVGAGHAAGCVTIFVDCGYDERLPDRPDHVVSDIVEAGRLILDRAGD
jgi:D-glycero-D-manno-heptose 1,7-bisphosphate phosphatase